MTLVRRSTTCCILVSCSAMCGAVAWRGTAGALSSVRCGVDGVGSARQAFGSASAFDQNIGSWNTASVTTISDVRALVPSHACGARPKSLSQQWSRAQMWGWPTSDVGESRRLCGRRPVADVGPGLAQLGTSLVSSIYEWLVPTTLVRWSTTHCIGVCCNAMYGAAARRGVARPAGSALCAALWTAWGRLGRRLPGRRRSTRTSAAGTPRL